MSCYTEEPLSVDDSHIDHFLVRDLFPQKDHVFDWNNLFADTREDSYSSRHKDSFVKTTEDNLKLLNPATDDVENLLYYRLDGKIAISGSVTDSTLRERCRYTIDAFNLNDPVLVRRRREFFTYSIEPLSAQGFSEEEILSCYRGMGFRTLIRQIYRSGE
ncbi:MAG: TIGR02646 family protein [Bacteroidales bacterium]|nr:TIGR02646 family protein [Bacteroidales bacterium]MBQ9710843.1 TIGR02646 family protein [Bacteroidales bacterium]